MSTKRLRKLLAALVILLRGLQPRGEFADLDCSLVSYTYNTSATTTETVLDDIHCRENRYAEDKSHTAFKYNYEKGKSTITLNFEYNNYESYSNFEALISTSPDKASPGWEPSSLTVNADPKTGFSVQINITGDTPESVYSWLALKWVKDNKKEFRYLQIVIT